MTQTTIRVDTALRDALARVAAERHETLGGALARLVWEHDCARSLERLQDDPEAYAEHLAEGEALAEAASEVHE